MITPLIPRGLVQAVALVLGLLVPTVHAQPTVSKRPPRPEASWIMPAITGRHLTVETFESKAAGEKVSYLLYLPPGYDESAFRYPVTYWLHGIGGSQQGAPAFCDRLTQAIKAGKTPPMIVVFVNGMIDSFYCDSATQRRPVETVIIRELIPHIDANYRTIASRQGRAVEGFSMGGFGAAHLGFKYPELFGAISMIDAALVSLETMQTRHADIFAKVFGKDSHAFVAAHPTTLAENNVLQLKTNTVIRQIVGPLQQPNEVLHLKLLSLNIPHDYHVFTGLPHSHQTIYDRLADANWTFYRKAFLTAESATVFQTDEEPTAKAFQIEP